MFEVWLDIPPYEDVNNNGIDDFYDPAVEVNFIVTEGVHPNDSGEPEPFTATWIRSAGDTMGGVVIDMPYFGLTFEHLFQIVQYKGEYTYNRTGSTLQGNIALTNVLSDAETIKGPLNVQVMNPDTLRLSATTWQNESGLDFVVVTNFFDGKFSTNFFSYWLLEDGVPANGVTDYVDWMMIISSGDANGNGVLDLVETGGGTSERPSLGIRRTETGYEITVTGTVGKSYRLEETTEVTATSWGNNSVITLTTATQNLTVPAGAAALRFFRLVEN